MESVRNAILIGTACCAGILPLALVLLAIFKREVWAWWQRTSWKGSLFLALTNVGLKISAQYFSIVVRQGFGYTEESTFNSIYRTLNCLDLIVFKAVTRLAELIVSRGAESIASDNIALAFGFVVVFVFFCGLRWLRNRFFSSFATDK